MPAVLTIAPYGIFKLFLLKSYSHPALIIKSQSRKQQMELIIHVYKLNNNKSVEKEKYFSYSLRLRETVRSRRQRKDVIS